MLHRGKVGGGGSEKCPKVSPIISMALNAHQGINTWIPSRSRTIIITPGSISSTFYARVFHTKVLREDFLLLHFGFGKRISAKKALLYKKVHVRCKMSMALTTGAATK